ncbi:BTB/POZ domain-containing protein At3g22104 [Linum perenne]
MEACCDLEVDVNGEETFMVDKLMHDLMVCNKDISPFSSSAKSLAVPIDYKKIISSYSGRLRKMFGKSTGGTGNFKVLFNDFPGGAEGFELMLRFCYKNGRLDITPSNLSLLHSAAKFMEMSIDSPSGVGQLNLLELTEKSLQQQMSYWTWSDLLVTLKQCQDLSSYSSGIVEKCVDSLIGRMALSSESSPCPSTSSQDSTSSGTVRVSCDSRSTESLKTRGLTWWFEDLSGLNLNLVELLVKSMASSKKFDHGTISRFLFYYQKSRCYSATADEKLKIVEVVIDLLHVLDLCSVPCKSLFGLLRVASSLNVRKCSRNKLESMIGSQLDQATLDNLLIPSPTGSNCLYDVNVVLRFFKSFLCGGMFRVYPNRLKKVASLMDMYIAEVAPDPCLRPSKFLALAMVLPDSARDSYDDLYRAMEMYLEVHNGLSDEEKMKICCALNYEKVSAEVCMEISRNKKFPSRTAIQALMSQQVKLKNLLQPTTTCLVDSPCSSLGETDPKANKNDEQIVLYAAKLDFSTDNERLRAHLQGMQWRVIELEKVCRKMQTQMTKIMKSKTPNRSLPRMCS